MEPGRLAHLGVSQPEETVYRHLLRHPGGRAEELASELTNHREDDLAVVLDKLSQRGLIQVQSDGRLTPAEPALVIDRLIAARLEKLHEELRQAVLSRHLVEDLLAEERERQHQQTEAGVNRIFGLDGVRGRIDELTFFTHQELLSVNPMTAISEAAISASRATDLRCLRRKITMRTIVRPESLDDEVTDTYLRDLVSRGAAIRMAEGVLERIMIFDRKVALVPFDPNSSARGALLIRQPVLIANLVGYFERVWASGTDMVADPSMLDIDDQLSDLDQQVLKLMVVVDKDEAGARELGVSVRTYRSYTARIMARLNTNNRFQAALRARENGWI